MNIFAAASHHLCFFSNDFPRLFTTYARCRPLSAQGRASVGTALEKHEYFCNGFPRLFTTYARYRSLSAESRASVEAAPEGLNAS